MATISTSTIGPGGIRKIRRWYNQYLATHGTPPPEHMMESYMRAEIEGQLAMADRARALGLEQERIDLAETQFQENLALEKEKLKREDEAAKTSGLLNIGMLALLGKDELKSGYKAIKSGIGKVSDKIFPESTTLAQTTTPKEAAPTQGAAATPVTYGPPKAIPAGSSFTVTPESFEGLTFCMGEKVNAGGALETTSAPAISEASTGAASTTTSTIGGIAGGVGTAAPYYGLAKVGGVIARSMGGKDTPLGKVGESLERPLNVERYFSRQLWGEVEPLETAFDLLNPLGAGERWVSDQIGTVVCTELHRQGLMDDETYGADAEFGRKQDFEVMVGYRLWARPLVDLMQKSKFVTMIVAPIALAWAKHMAYSEGVNDKPSMVGELIHKIGVPICKYIGRRKLGGLSWIH